MAYNRWNILCTCGTVGVLVLVITLMPEQAVFSDLKFRHKQRSTGNTAAGVVHSILHQNRKLFNSKLLLSSPRYETKFQPEI